MKLSDVDRRARDAATRIESVALNLRYIYDNADESATPWQTADDVRWLCSYHATDLMTKVVSDLEMLVPVLDLDDDWRNVAGDVRSLADAVRARVLAAKLDNVEGRTPEEAEAFRAKARELRGETS